MTPRKPVSARPPTTQTVSSGRMWDLVLIALYLCRFLIPAEGVDQGDTLWIAASWDALAAVRIWSRLRQGRSLEIQWNLTDLGVGLLVLGYGLSSLLVLAGSGDKRAALNFFWEWISIGWMWILLKDALSRPEFRRLISSAVIVTFATLAGMGIWQHFIWYPQQSREMTQLLEFKGAVEAGTPLSPSDRTQFESLREKYGSELLSLEETGQKMLLARTRDSREPIGRFALANSFAALLLVGWFGCMGWLVTEWLSTKSPRSLFIIAAGAGVVSICLLLTKSRTAVLGLVAALLCLGVHQSLLPGPQRRRTLQLGIGLLIGLMLLAAALLLLGGLDRQVLSEAPKSLSYRLEYWQATAQMILDHPWTGVGPGNFRQHYFAYKLPGASEEILDPHNMFLDVWANGGLLALLGLVMICCVWGARLWSWPHHADSVDQQPTPVSHILILGAMAFGTVLAEEWLLEGFVDKNLIGLAVGWFIITLLFRLAGPCPSMAGGIPLCAGIAILVHLLGAGGIGMPAILQLLLLMLLLTEPEISSTSFVRRNFLIGMMLLSGLAAIGSLWMGVVPVVSVARLIDQGRYEFVVAHRPGNAEKYFQQAVSADRLAWQPHEELAGLSFHQWKNSSGARDDLFENAIREKTEALQRNPLAAKEYLTLSDWWLQRHLHDSSMKSAEEARDAAAHGAELYPNFSRMQAQLAFSELACHQPGRAREAARKALQLDDLNISRGHTDKMLTAELRSRLESIAQPAETAP